MFTKFKKLMALVLVLALIVPSLTFAETGKGLEAVSDNAKLQERAKEIKEKIRTKADIDLDVEADTPIRVIVELEDRPAISFATDKGISYNELSVKERANIEANVKKVREDVKSRIKSRRIDFSFERDFSVVFNGFSGTVKYEDIEKIKTIPGVRDVYISQEYTRPIVDIDMKSSHEIIGSYETWELDYKGEGMVIAIIDTGVDPSHKDFVISEGTEVALTKEYVDGLDVPGKYFTEKVPYGYNYFDLNNEIRDLGPDASEHGMHVAGTAAANGNPEKGGIRGVAPEAQVLAMKVFSNDPTFGSTYDDIYLDAIDDAIKLGADVLNMSLGSTAGFVNYQSAVNRAITNAVENGIVCSISAGNSALFGDGWDLPYKENPDIGVVGSPGISRDSLQVASIENVRSEQNYLEYTIEVVEYEALPSQTIIIVDKAYDINYLDDNTEVQEELVRAFNNQQPLYFKITSDMLVSLYTGQSHETLPEDLPSTVTYRDSEGNESVRLVLGEGGSRTEVVKVPMQVSTSSPVLPSDVIKEPIDYVYCGIGTAADFQGVNVTGKIALVQRGNTFTDTIANAEANGAVGVIVFNHAAGGEDLVNMAYPEGGTIPAAFIGHKGGSDLLERVGTVKISFPEGTITVNNPSAGYMSNFSSWGTTPNLELKPEITAPGSKIYSTLQNDRYGIMSGTSMAAPHVAGGSALVMQYIKQHEEYGQLDLEDQVRLAKVLLMNTANILPNPNTNYETPYSPRSQGAGVMNLHGAVTTPVRVINSANGEAKVELKEFDSTNFEFTLEVINDSDEDITYDVEVLVLADEIIRGAGYYPTVDYITTNSRLVDARVTGDGEVLVPANDSVGITITVDFSGDEGIYENMFIEGFVVLNDTEDTHPTLSVPYVGFYGDWNEPRILDIMRGEEEVESIPFYGYGGMIDPAGYFYNTIFMSPGTVFGNMFDTDIAIPVLSLLRNAEDIQYNILDEAGNKLRTIYRDSLRKNYYDSGSAAPYYIRNSAAWDGTVRGKVVADGKYYYEIKAKINYEGAEYQSVRIPVYIDTQVPVVTDVRYDRENKVLTWEATDGEGSGIQFFDIVINGEYISDDLYYPEDLLVEGNKYSIDVVPFDLNDVHEVEIQAYDYAFNIGFGTGIVGNNVANIYLYEPEVLGVYDSKWVSFIGEIDTPYIIREVTIDGKPVNAVYNYSYKVYEFYTTLEYEDGYHEAVIAVKTTTGEEASIARMFWVDSTRPVLAVNGGELNEDGNIATLNLTLKDNFPYAELYIDDSLELLEDRMDRLSVIEPIEITRDFEVVLVEGQTYIELRLVDFAGNTATVFVDVDGIGTPIVDKSKLQAKIVEAQALNEDDYTEESWQNLAQALTAAIAVLEDEEATQLEVDGALAALIEAMNGLVEKPKPQIVATYHPTFIPTFGYVSVEVYNLDEAEKFSVVYHLSDDEDGNEVIEETKIVNIGEEAGSIFYDPNQYDTVDIKIYDENENLIYTFEDVVLDTASVSRMRFLDATSIILGNEEFDIDYLNSNSDAQGKLIRFMNSGNEIYIRLKNNTVINLEGKIIKIEY